MHFTFRGSNMAMGAVQWRKDGDLRVGHEVREVKNDRIIQALLLLRRLWLLLCGICQAMGKSRAENCCNLTYILPGRWVRNYRKKTKKQGKIFKRHDICHILYPEVGGKDLAVWRRQSIFLILSPSTDRPFYPQHVWCLRKKKCKCKYEIQVWWSKWGDWWS